jgi:predicted enzyme involved in methoxymalonyl-ACP biosynthesis
LDDRYGTYGTIGLALVERGADVWTLKLLLTSCRVMSRGVGAVLLTYILRRAARVGVRFLAEFVPTERNRIMYVTYRFAGFREIHADGGTVLLENDHSRLPGFPPHMTIVVEDS